MKTRQEFLAGILCLLVSFSAAAQQESWQARSARIKITPELPV